MSLSIKIAIEPIYTQPHNEFTIGLTDYTTQNFYHRVKGVICLLFLIVSLAIVIFTKLVIFSFQIYPLKPTLFDLGWLFLPPFHPSAVAPQMSYIAYPLPSATLQTHQYNTFSSRAVFLVFISCSPHYSSTPPQCP